MTGKQLLRMFLFILCVGLFLFVLCDLFENKNTPMTERYATYKSFPEDTVDAVYLGTSGVDRYWIAAKAFEEYGMTVYPLSTDGAEVWSILPMLKEAFRFQNPGLVLVDVRPFIVMNSTIGKTQTDVRSRRTIDMLDFFSPNRIEMIKNTRRAMNTLFPEEEHSFLSYYLSFVRYHEMWTEDDFSFDNIGEKESATLGFYMAKSQSVYSIVRGDTNVTEEYRDLDPVFEYFLYELLDYAEKEKINLLFVNSPELQTVQQAAICNTLYSILDAYGVPYIDFNKTEVAEKYTFDRTTDFYDNQHVNYYGAEKYTTYLSEYLNEQYVFPDRRGEKGTEQWNGVYDHIKEVIEVYNKKKK